MTTGHLVLIAAFGLATMGCTVYGDPIPAAAVQCSFHPDRIDQLIEGHIATVYVNCTARQPTSSGSIALRAVVDNARIAAVVGDNVFLCRYGEQSSWEAGNSSFSIEALFLGRTSIRIEPVNVSDGLVEFVRWNSTAMEEENDDDGVSSVGSLHVQPFDDYQVSVIREVRLIDHLFMGLVSLMVICANIGMGCKIELAVVKEVLTRPIAPVIGFCCQYILMPLTAYAVVKLLGLTGGMALGYFAAGCAPGGGSSNMYTYLLGGDVSLSVTMTLISVLASLGMIPLWLFTLGTLLIEKKTRIVIPFANIMISLACILIPIIIGLLIQYYCKRASQIIVRCLRPFYILFILCMFTFGVWSNLYIFQLITPLIILAGCLLPYIGFGLSALVAFILQQPRSRVITIAIETGIQNTGLPIIIMKFSLPQPEADLAVVAPIVIAMFMPLPLWIAVAVTEIRRRCCHQQRHSQDGDLNVEMAACKIVDPGSADGLLANGDSKPDTNGFKELSLAKSPSNGHSCPVVDVVMNGDTHTMKL